MEWSSSSYFHLSCQVCSKTSVGKGVGVILVPSVPRRMGAKGPDVEGNVMGSVD